jgi:acyl carrier protein
MNVEALTNVLKEKFPEVPLANLDASRDLLDEGLLDSLQLIEFIVDLERRLGKPILSEHIRPEWIRTLNAICEHFCQDSVQ